MFSGWLWPLLLLGVLVAVVLAMRDLGRDGGDDGTRAAEEALARRYAEGDIDEDEYRRRVATLTQGRPRSSQQSWWPLAIAVGAIVLLVAALLWGGMSSGWMWDTMGRQMGWVQ